MTRKELLNMVVEQLQTSEACARHGVKAENVQMGKSNGDIEAILADNIYVYAFPAETQQGEHNHIRRVDIVIFCTYEADPDAAVSENLAWERAEQIEAVIIKNTRFRLMTNPRVELDGSYPGYAAAMFTFRHSIESSAV